MGRLNAKAHQRNGDENGIARMLPAVYSILKDSQYVHHVKTVCAVSMHRSRMIVSSFEEVAWPKRRLASTMLNLSPESFDTVESTCLTSRIAAALGAVLDGFRMRVRSSKRNALVLVKSLETMINGPARSSYKADSILAHVLIVASTGLTIKPIVLSLST